MIENVINRILAEFQDETTGLDVELTALETVESVAVTMDVPKQWWIEYPVPAQVQWPFVTVVCDEGDIEFHDVNGKEDHFHRITCGYYTHGGDRQELKRIAFRSVRAMEKVLLGQVEGHSDSNVSIIQIIPEDMVFALGSGTGRGFSAPVDLFAGGELTVRVRERVTQP